MTHAELAYFEGHHCKHVADFHEQQRLERINDQCRRAERKFRMRRRG